MTAAKLKSLEGRRRWLAGALVAFQILGAPGVTLAQGDDEIDVERVDEETSYDLDLYQVGATALDITVLRPLGGLTLLGGFAFFAASMPFVAPAEGIGASWDIFVYSSYDYTVLRPLGELF